MSPLLIAALCLAFFAAGAAAGAGVGLWMGEKANRIAWQNMKVMGHPDGAVRAQVTINEDLPETRIIQSGFSDKTISKGVESIMQEAAKEGRPLSRDDARAIVLQMLDPEATPELML